MRKNNFDWADPFLLERQLTAEEKMTRESARRYAAQKLSPRVVAAYREEKTDKNIFAEMGAAGFFGLTIPDSLGGADSGYVAYGLVGREIERVDSGYRTIFSVQNSLVIYPLATFGCASQRQKYLPKLINGESAGCFGLTEANAGSDAAAMTTTAEKTADGYKLNGEKSWISSAPLADVFIVWAKSAAHDKKICAFIMDKNTPGLSVTAIRGKMSLRTSATGRITLDNARVGDDALLPRAIGLSTALSCLMRARYGLSWGALGAAEFCWHAAREYGLSRKQFGKPLAATQLFQQKLARMQTDIALGLQASLRVGRLMDDGLAAPEMVSLIKRNNCRRALEICREARDMHGANGIAEEFHIMRHLCNMESVNTYEGAYDIHSLILGAAQTGIKAFC